MTLAKSPPPLGVALLALSSLSLACGSSTETGGQGGAGADGQVHCGDEPREVMVIFRNASASRLWIQHESAGGVLLGYLGNLQIDGQGPPWCACDHAEPCSAGASVGLTYGFLEPGDEHSISWNGLLYEDPASRPACVDEQDCALGLRASDGMHEMSATAYRSFDECIDPCECNLALEQICGTGSGASGGSNPVTSSTSFALPATGPVVIDFSD